MNCIPEGALRARIDGELSELDLQEVERHLASCVACRERATAVAKQAANIQVKLSTLAPAAGEPLTDPSIAFSRFQARMESEEIAVRPPVLSRFRRAFRPAWAAAAGIVLVIACFSFTPARTWGQRFLAMLRVQKVAVITFDPQAFSQTQHGPNVSKMLGQLISDEVTVTMSPGKPQPAADASQASEMAGFRVRLVGMRSDAPSILVHGETAFNMVLNRERAMSILQAAGRSDLDLPSSVDGAQIAVHIPKAVFAHYGTMPAIEHGAPLAPDQQKAMENFLALIEAPSPTVSVPPNLDMAQIAEIGMELAGVDSAEARSLCQNIDWTSTLVIPVPRGDATSQSVPVDGVQGTMVTLRGNDKGRHPGYSLIWIRTGVIHALNGFGDASRGLAYAQSLN